MINNKTFPIYLYNDKKSNIVELYSHNITYENKNIDLQLCGYYQNCHICNNIRKDFLNIENTDWYIFSNKILYKIDKEIDYYKSKYDGEQCIKISKVSTEIGKHIETFSFGIVEIKDNTIINIIIEEIRDRKIDKIL